MVVNAKNIFYIYNLTKYFMAQFQNDIDFSNENDEYLWTELKSGNRGAFVYIYNLYIEDLVRYGNQIVADKPLVEDAIQDIFVSFWEKRDKLADVRSIKFYLLTAIRRILLRKIKKERLFISRNFEKTEMFEIVPSFLDENLRLSSENDLKDKINSVISKLTRRQREIIYLKFYHNLSYKEIADMLKLDQKYTYNLAARALSNFKDKFILVVSIFIIF